MPLYPGVRVHGILRDVEELQEAERLWPDQKQQPSRESKQKKRSRQWVRLVDRELGGHLYHSASPQNPAGGMGVGLNNHGEPQRGTALVDLGGVHMMVEVGARAAHGLQRAGALPAASR
jgi:hypothetical protein